MNRRTFLGAVGAGVVALGGVAAVSSDGREKRVSIDSVDSVPDAHEFGIDATVLDERLTSRKTASVRVTVTNHRAEDRRISDGGRKLFSTVSSTEPGLLLLDGDASPPRTPGCWRPLFGQSRSMELRIAEIPPNGTSHLDLDVWGESGVSLGDCVPTGAFRFDTTYRVFGTEGDREFDWGFVLSVEEKRG